MKMRTMRDIPTIQGLRERATPTTREQAISELARLEHEKARLSRELDLWTSKQQNTSEKIQQVEQRLLRLRQIIEPEAAQAAPGRAVSRSAKSEGGEEKEHKESRTVVLHY